MHRSYVSRFLVLLCTTLPVVPPILPAHGQTSAPALPAVERRTGSLGDLSSFRAIADDTLRIVNTGDLLAARTRIKDLETAWDKAEETLRPRDREQWRVLDKFIDAALTKLRADNPTASASSEALKSLIALLSPATSTSSRSEPDRKAAAQARSQGAELPTVSLVQAISIAEAREQGAAVLDVSYEPQNGHPFYQVRTVKDGHVWDGLIDATNGQVVEPGTSTAESALDDEDKAELHGLKSAKTSLREATAIAGRHGTGRAISAGLEEVSGRVLWDVNVQKGESSRRILVDPTTGNIHSLRSGKQ
jgi:uncharacterized membrane protein YkoI